MGEIDPSKSVARALAAVFLVFLFQCSIAAGEDDDLSILARLPTSEATADDWAWASRKIADKQSREEIRAALLKRREFPRAELVGLLRDEHLAVRLGALELLEEAAGDGYGFNAWASPAGDGADPRNEHALEVWNNWAGQEGKVKGAGPVLSEEQMQGYIRDIISGSDDRKTRAVRMLEPHGMKGVTAIQEFIIGKPGLQESSRVGLKEAQYHLVLARTAGENASALARDLTRGNRDQQLGGLSALKRSGFLVIPIVRDFLGSKDALVRETAIDAILSLGGAQTVSLVAPFLEKEEDVNVIHAAMRRFREIGGAEVEEIITRYLDHDDEDLVIAALQSITKLSDDSDNFDFGGLSSNQKKSAEPKETVEKIVKLLEDPRWRVRSSALEYVTAKQVRAASDRVVAMLEDEDEFVRSNAIKAVVAMNLTQSQDRLIELFKNDDEMIAPATGAFTSMGKALPQELVAHLDTRPPDVIVGAIRALDSSASHALKNVARFASHENLDISCAALRVLGDDDDKLKINFVANHLTAALKSGNEEKITAVLDTIDLPSTSSSDRSLMRLLGGQNREKTSLDPLYEAFLEPLRKEQEKAEAEAPAPAPAPDSGVTGGLATLLDALAEHGNNWEKPEAAFRASLLLAEAGDPRGLELLVGRVDKLSVSERAAIADSLYYLRSKEGIPLFRLLLQDDIPNVRQEAASSAFSDEGALVLIELGLEGLSTEGTKLTGSEAYSYNLEEVASDRRSQRLVNKWCKRMLVEDSTPDETRILALVLMRQAMSASDVDLLEPFTKSEDQWIRRAAWYSLGKARPRWLADNLERLMDDPSPRVREVLPWAAGSISGSWQHYFSDNRRQADRSSSSSSRRPSASVSVTDALRKLAESDPSPEVRFESWFALLSLSKPIELDAFTKLLAQQPPESKVAKRLADYIESNYSRMGQGMKVLLAYADVKEISQSRLPAVMAHFSKGGTGESFTSFAALAKATEASGEPQVIEPAVDPEEMAAKRQRLVVVEFYQPGCDQCEKVHRYLEDLKEKYPLMEVDRRTMRDQNNVLLNQALCDRLNGGLGVRKTPSVFTQAGAAIAPKTKPEMLQELVQRTMEMPDDQNWNVMGEAEIVEAKEKVEESFTNLTLPIVLIGGLLDGINPCAFATIIFFLSYLQVARRSPREILFVGIAFILAVFLAYFSVGLVFHSLVEKLVDDPRFKWVRHAMTYVFAFFALLVAVLSLRDAIRARKGRLEDMTLQLPKFLKKRIRGVIRKGARARNFVLAAFVSGIVISFLELACTGQVYVPIVYQIQQGSTNAIFYLLIYNLAFIFPLVVIFILAFFGMTSDSLIKFQQKHTAAVKFATAILFFLLAAVILFGDKLLPHG